MATPAEIGRLIRRTRVSSGLTQENLALAAGTGRRFIVDLEKGKPTSQLGGVLQVLHALGIQITLTPPEPEPGVPPENG